jgi:hypothetical protein
MYGEYSDSGSSQSVGDSKKQPTVPVETKEERRKRIREEEKSRGTYLDIVKNGLK